MYIHVYRFSLLPPSQSLTSAEPSSLSEVGEASSSLASSLCTLMETVTNVEGEKEMAHMQDAFHDLLSMARIMQRCNHNVAEIHVVCMWCACTTQATVQRNPYLTYICTCTFICRISIEMVRQYQICSS